MTVIQIQNSKSSPPLNSFALFNLGFRPFFLGAGVFAAVLIAWWMVIYSGMVSLSMTTLSNSQWHAHEMLYGYGMAVVAGFLLTAVKNWTGIQTSQGKRLMLLFGLWCFARIALLFGTAFLLWAMVADLLFGLFLLWAITLPIIQSKQWGQLAVMTKVLLLWIGNLLFYLGVYHVMDDGITYAINGAVLLFMGLILMLGRRVVPFFIERGVGYKVALKQYRWLDLSILGLFVALFVNAIFFQSAAIVPYLALSLFALNSFRLFNWHTYGIWQIPLLWSLYLSLCLINLGFLCYGLQDYLHIPYVLMLHIFTIGGMGLITLSMMSRVALGHTGRDIRTPPSWLKLVFTLVPLAFIFRVFAPLILPQYYVIWILVSASLWVVGFAIFVVIYAPILWRPRVDGALG